MSEKTESETDASSKNIRHRHPDFLRQHLLDEITLLVLISCSYIGVAYSDISPARSQHYWYLMVPVFYIASLTTEWHHVKAGKYPWKTVLWNHTLQWLAVLASVKMVFVIQQIGRLNNETTGLILLLLFALTTFITGIRMGWLFRLAGIFLAASLLLLAYLERYLWLLVLLGVIMLIFHHFIVRKNKHHQQKPSAAG